jgi:hypothetical protein
MSQSDIEFFKVNGLDIAAYHLLLKNSTIQSLLDLVEAKILEAIDSLETDANNISSLQEDGFSTVFCRTLTNGTTLLATQQQNSRGHVDITITSPMCKDPHEFKYLGEAKIWRGSAYAIAGFDQLDGYMTGRHRKSMLLFYFQTQTCDEIFKEYVFELIQKRGGKCIFSKPRQAATEHVHSSSAIIVVDHFAAHIPARTR